MKTSFLTALAIALAVGAWLGSSYLSSDTGDAKPSSDRSVSEAAGREPDGTAAPAEPVAVRVRTLVAQKRAREVVVRGRTEALREVLVKAEIDGRVVAVTAREGARVKTGDVIARLDMRERDRMLAEAEALVNQRKLEYEAARALAAKGYRAATKMAQAVTLLEAARTTEARVRREIAHTNIHAPFAGVLEVRHAEQGDFLKKGEPVALVVDRDPLVVVAQVSEREVGHLTLGDSARAKLITGKVVEGKVRYIATKADPATRTFRIELEVPNSDFRLRAGITAELRIAVAAVPAHLVSPAVLTLNDAGELGVKTVDSDGRVQFRPVEIIGDDPRGVWLGNLPDAITLITVGQEYVRHGDTVTAVPESAEAS